MLAAAGFGLAVFFAQGGWRILSPTQTSWIAPGSDYGYHWIGWEYFRRESWHLPLGAIPSLFHPVGTTVGYMDGIPWLALVAKLAAPMLPDPIQYIGSWLAICFVLQGWFGARLIAALTPSRTAAFAGGCLFVIAPVLLHRVNHEALCAHFLVLAALTLYMRQDERAPRWSPILLPAFAIGIHPYLAVMTAAVCFAADVRYVLDGLVSWRGAAWRIGAAIAALAALGLLFGYLQYGSDMAGRGFGRYNSELLSLVNSGGMSRVLPELPIRAGQTEGYGFVGTGVLALGIAAIALEVRARHAGAPPLPWRRMAPLVVAAIALAIFAWGSKLSVLGKDLVGVGRLYPRALAETFRSSGRFIWVAAYVATLAALAIWLARLPRWAPLAFGAACLLQLTDTRGVFGAGRFGAPYEWPAESPRWAQLAAGRRHLVLFPPRCGDGSSVCCPLFTPPPRPEDMFLAWTSVRLGLTYNGFGAARVPHPAHEAYCRQLSADLEDAHLDRASIYVIDREQEAFFRDRNPSASCEHIDDSLVCVAP